MKRSLRHFVRERAGRRCEYCHIPDAAVPAASFHLEHVLAKQHGGVDAPLKANPLRRLGRATVHSTSGRDPLTGKVVRLFHPRRQRHFEWMRFILVGRTAIGRATVAALDINDPQRVQLRIEFGEVGG